MRKRTKNLIYKKQKTQLLDVFLDLHVGSQVAWTIKERFAVAIYDNRMLKSTHPVVCAGKENGQRD
jgi:hypothetical protein